MSRQQNKRHSACKAVVSAATLSLLLSLIGAATAGPKTTFSGSADGIFTNPAGGITTGVGTSNFSWGTGDPSRLQFTGKNFTITTPTGYIYGTVAQNSRPTFALGTLNYYNGSIFGGTGADSVQLDASVSLSVPVGTSAATVPSTLSLINTPNTSDPAASADQVFLPKNLLPVAVKTSGGAPISIEPVGFGNVSAGGFVTTIDRFNVFEQASASADFLAKIASPCEPIVRGAVTTTIASKTMRAGFTPKFSLSLIDAAKLCGYSNFNWLQVITTDPYPPSGQVPPYIDPPVGGGSAFGGCADDLPFYWDERLCPTNGYSLSSNVSTNSLSYTDTPSEPRLTGGQFLAFTTSLVGVNQDNTYEILYTWSWKSNNTGGAGGVFRRTLEGDSDTGGVGDVFDVQTDLSPWEVPESVRNLWASTGALNADNGIDLRLIDDVAPVTLGSVTPAANANGWNNSNVTISFNSTDNETGGTGVREIDVSWNGAQSGSSVIAGASGTVNIAAEGTTTVTYFGVDNAGNVESAKFLAVKIDKTPPFITGLPASDCTLWPPNHKLVQIATVNAMDSLSGLSSFDVSGTSSEPVDANGPDVVVTGEALQPKAVQLRAERLGTGTGRLYTITATAVDAAGNTATAKATCTVPHGQGH